MAATKKYPMASYRNSAVVAPTDERVLSIVEEPNGSRTLKTISGRRTYTYRGVPIDFKAGVGETLTEKPPHRSWSLNVCWSPFDHDPTCIDD